LFFSGLEAISTFILAGRGAAIVIKGVAIITGFLGSVGDFVLEFAITTEGPGAGFGTGAGDGSIGSSGITFFSVVNDSITASWFITTLSALVGFVSVEGFSSDTSSKITFFESIDDTVSTVVLASLGITSGSSIDDITTFGVNNGGLSKESSGHGSRVTDSITTDGEGTVKSATGRGCVGVGCSSIALLSRVFSSVTASHGDGGAVRGTVDVVEGIALFTSINNSITTTGVTAVESACISVDI
jgi:hypothetical protein